MIAWHEPDADTVGTLIDEGKWRVIQVEWRPPVDELGFFQEPKPETPRKGFRSAALNPAKRIPSPKRKRK